MVWLIVWILLAIILAAVIGFIFGWWIRAKICARAVADRDARIAQLKLERDNAAANRPSQSGPVSIPTPVREAATDESLGPTANGGPIAPSFAEKRESNGAQLTAASAAAPPQIQPSDADKPIGLNEPRGGMPDELRRISGVGPKIEKTLHGLGIFHFDQIAAWDEGNVAWVDGYLRFRGRIDRERWIEQARVLAAGGETDFSKRFDQ